jgi:hypothetical protein
MSRLSTIADDDVTHPQTGSWPIGWDLFTLHASRDWSRVEGPSPDFCVLHTWATLLAVLDGRALMRSGRGDLSVALPHFH